LKWGDVAKCNQAWELPTGKSHSQATPASQQKLSNIVHFKECLVPIEFAEGR
jgi:hypothetical protein